MRMRNFSPKSQSLFIVSFVANPALSYSLSEKCQQYCEILKDHGQEYTTLIKSVTDNGANNYTIELRVTHNGCTDTCKSMARYSVEAIPGTYSDVSITVVSGNLNYKNIDLGPKLAGDPFDGFRITGTSGFGNGAPGEFIIKHTLSGGLQNKRTQVKAGGDFLLVSFSAKDFQNVLNCQYYNPNSAPVYVPVDPDNYLTGPGLFENSQQPQLFLPGTSNWQARFNGDKITWVLNTYNGTHKSSTASDASSSSNKCTKSATIATANSDVQSFGPEVLTAYPNPTHNKVNQMEKLRLV